MDDQRIRRHAENETRLRALNERVHDAVAELEDDPVRFQAMCECSRPECEVMLDVGDHDYGRIREHATWFLLDASHIDDPNEHVVERHDGWVAVAKTDLSADIARDQE